MAITSVFDKTTPWPPWTSEGYLSHGQLGTCSLTHPTSPSLSPRQVRPPLSILYTPPPTRSIISQWITSTSTTLTWDPLPTLLAILTRIRSWDKRQPQKRQVRPSLVGGAWVYSRTMRSVFQGGSGLRPALVSTTLASQTIGVSSVSLRYSDFGHPIQHPSPQRRGAVAPRVFLARDWSAPPAPRSQYRELGKFVHQHSGVRGFYDSLRP